MKSPEINKKVIQLNGLLSRYDKEIAELEELEKLLEENLKSISEGIERVRKTKKDREVGYQKIYKKLTKLLMKGSEEEKRFFEHWEKVKKIQIQ